VSWHSSMGAPRKQWLDNNQEWSGNTYQECWHKIETVKERCPGSGHYLSRNLVRGTYPKKQLYSVSINA